MRYVESPSVNPYERFAIETYLLNERLAGEGFLIFWRTEPTLMLGRNQNAQAEINGAYAREHGIHVVRRLSGGGTIYTDLNTWQYSYILKKEGGGVDFEPYTRRVAGALRALGVPASFSGRNDVTAGGRKISGSAQYIAKDRMIHHGSLLYATDLERMARALTVSGDKLVSKGIQSVRQRVANISEFLPGPPDALKFKADMLGFLLGPQDSAYTLSEADAEGIRRIARGKFESPEWNTDAAPAFQTVKSRRLPGGRVEFRFDVENGRVARVKIYGDFFSDRDVGFVEEVLSGCRYEREALRKALDASGAGKVFYRIGEEELLDCILDA